MSKKLVKVNLTECPKSQGPMKENQKCESPDKPKSTPAPATQPTQTESNQPTQIESKPTDKK